MLREGPSTPCDVSSMHSLSGSETQSERYSRERRLYQNSKERQKPAPRPRHVSLAIINRQLVERARTDPVPKTNHIVIRTAASHEDDTEQDETDDGDDFHAREPELGFAVCAHAEEIYQDDEDEADGHVYCGMGVCVCCVSTG